MASDLLELKNLGNTSINWLRSIGVNTQAELQEKGAVEAYHEIKQRGIRVSKVLLYALHGAMTDTHWNDIDDATKQHLLQLAEELCDTNPA
ncbi:TfoX/Sxy family protein [Oceanicoccus sp. KOV_DT_Chl]|uniref:TfoX/Sxy family protein n=1 Tax=Oceanicoccus sp. KOV_DT_Chl TaxID=1904639 RepID=UPI000C7A03AC|nr:TfoX/Sxy family protein [Oceanicoccus sp. KOV_DT_Chl]